MKKILLLFLCLLTTLLLAACTTAAPAIIDSEIPSQPTDIEQPVSQPEETEDQTNSLNQING